MGARVGASKNAKGTSKGFVIKGSIADRRSEKHTCNIMRWDRSRALRSKKLIEWEGAVMKKVEGRMEDLGRWARKGSKRIKSS
jgi:hypothetical protein